VPVAELGPAIGVVQVDDNVGRDRGARSGAARGRRPRLTRRLASLKRTERSRDGERRSDVAKSISRQVPWRAHASDIPVARDLRYGRSTRFWRPRSLPGPAPDIGGGRRIEEHRAHAVQIVFEGRQKRRRRIVVKQWYVEAAAGPRVVGWLGSRPGCRRGCSSLRSRGSRDTSCGKFVWADAAPRGASPRAFEPL